MPALPLDRFRDDRLTLREQRLLQVLRDDPTPRRPVRIVPPEVRARIRRRCAVTARLFGDLPLGTVDVHRARLHWLDGDQLVVVDGGTLYADLEGRTIAYQHGAVMEFDRGQCVRRTTGSPPELLRGLHSHPMPFPLASSP